MNDLELLERKRQQLAHDLEMQQRAAEGMQRKVEQMKAEQTALEASIEKAKNDPKRVHIEAINECLARARAALVEAGQIAEQHKIPFTFITPKGQEERYLWQHSSCYGEDRWYDEHVPYTEDDTHWQHSNC